MRQTAGNKFIAKKEIDLWASSSGQLEPYVAQDRQDLELEALE